jgi:biotin operon repressor/DNA-binding XRE family transcriptional regulator
MRNNNLRRFRGDMFQDEFARRLGIPYITAPILSLMEHDKIEPTKSDKQAIASKLGCTVRDIWPDDSYTPVPQKRTEPFINDESMERVLQHIPAGKRNAISRKELSAKMGIGDRDVRAHIAHARCSGHLILSSITGGYYLADDTEDVVRFYWQNFHRAQALWVWLAVIRKYLDRNIPGQIKLGSCLRCGDPIEDGTHCWSCQMKIK